MVQRPAFWCIRELAVRGRAAFLPKKGPRLSYSQGISSAPSFRMGRKSGPFCEIPRPVSSRLV